MRTIKSIPFYFPILLVVSCTEPFPIETIDLDNFLVVESTITNEMKRQVVKLSRTTSLESFDQLLEDNAVVKIESNEGGVFNFSWDAKTENYKSDIQFQAMPDVAYNLKVSTQDGRKYTSTAVRLTPLVEIDTVYAELTLEGIEGIQVYVDTYDVTGKAKYFRYEYEETYMVKVPNPADLAWEIVDYDHITKSFDIILTDRVPETICYASNLSSGILQTSTSDFEENRVFRLPIQFIYRENSMLRERYSILVKQYVQSLEGYSFYNTIEELGNVGDVLSQGQPGFVTGNMSSEESNEKVLGFFEASSVSTKRIYFNYKDFGFQFPPYFFECEKLELFVGETLKRKLEEDNYHVVDYEQIGSMKEYHIYWEGCTDCTSFASKIKPDFWED